MVRYGQQDTRGPHKVLGNVADHLHRFLVERVVRVLLPPAVLACNPIGGGRARGCYWQAAGGPHESRLRLPSRRRRPSFRKSHRICLDTRYTSPKRRLLMSMSRASSGSKGPSHAETRASSTVRPSYCTSLNGTDGCGDTKSGAMRTSGYERGQRFLTSTARRCGWTAGRVRSKRETDALDLDSPAPVVRWLAGDPAGGLTRGHHRNHASW